MNAKPLYRGAIPTSSTAVYTVPNGLDTELTEIALTNTTGANISVTVYLVPGGGVSQAATANELYGGFVLSANGENTDDFKLQLQAGDSIVISASAVGANIYITGIEVPDATVVQVRD